LAKNNIDYVKCSLRGSFGGELREAWTDLLTALESLSEEAAKADRLMMAHGPELPEGPACSEIAEVLTAIVAYLESTGRLIACRGPS
jgi:hypothetical protein